MNEVYCAINWVEYPAHLISLVGAAALFTEESEAWCVFVKKVANELFYGNINI
jgi:hypothetical protein